VIQKEFYIAQIKMQQNGNDGKFAYLK
jgi:branched-chain amino acid transport system substrate-binding protein